MRLIAACIVVVGTVACGGSPTQPTPNPVPNPGPQQQTWTIGGTVTATVTGEPVSGATLTFSSGTVTSGADGRWAITGAGTIPSSLSVTVAAIGYITRTTALRGQNGRADANVDIIRDAAPFSLAHYRQLVRDDFDTPGRMYGLYRWTANTRPLFHINAINPRTSESISDVEIATAVSAIRTAVTDLTGGALSADFRITRGSAATAQVLGEITVNYVYRPDATYCGRAFVESNSGLIELNYDDDCTSPCGSEKLPGELIAHETGHALGFYHARTGVMANAPSGCGPFAFSEEEKRSARIAYARPNGNLDVDRDALDFLGLQAPSRPRRIVECRR